MLRDVFACEAGGSVYDNVVLATRGVCHFGFVRLLSYYLHTFLEK